MSFNSASPQDWVNNDPDQLSASQLPDDNFHEEAERFLREFEQDEPVIHLGDYSQSF